MNNTEVTENWYSRGKEEADKGIPTSERIFGVGIVVFCVIMMWFFHAHQTGSTGFFTAKFGTLEMFMFYGTLAFWIITAGLEGVLGQRLLSRLFDTFGGIIFAMIATAWLLVVFPFEFAYFADVLPDSLRFLAKWISNEIAWVVMLLAIIAYLAAAVYAPIAYGFVGKKGQEPTTSGERMKAVIYTKYGPPDVLQLKEVEKPVPKNNELLIKIQATAVTASDCIVRGFKLPRWSPLGFMMGLALGFRKPRQPILGMVLAGDIESVGKDVKRFKKGDSVYGMTGLSFSTYAEYKSISEKECLVQKPPNVSYEEAAAAAYGAIIAGHFIKKADIQKGQKVLIYGASGANGTTAVQLAKHYGAEVTGVCSTKNLEFVKTLGADSVIDYTKEDLISRGERFDLIFDAVGNTKTSKLKSQSKKVLTTNGRYISVDKGSPKSLPEHLELINDLMKAGEFKAIIDRTYPLEQIVEAHRYVDKGHKKGNVVVIMDHNAGLGD